MNINWKRISVFLWISLLCISCVKDPLKDITLEGRQFFSFTVPGQVGPAIIKSGVDDTGTIEIFVVKNPGDLVSVRPDFIASEGASVLPNLGVSVNLEGPDPVEYLVISQSGKRRIWTVIVRPYESTIEGAWRVKNPMLIGTSELMKHGVGACLGHLMVLQEAMILVNILLPTWWMLFLMLPWKRIIY